MNRKYWIILADTQLGAIHWQNPTREEDYYQAFQTQCQTAAKDPNCLGILGLGDLRERASLQAKNLGGLNRGLHTLAQANKVLLGIMGNHDFTMPNWIEEMCYPSLKNLADPKIQEEYGFDPKTTLALNFTPKSQLLQKIQEHNPQEIELLFLHQSLKELTTTLQHSHDLSLSDLKTLGVGSTKKCLVFLGDLHNYGDSNLENITAAYPGSLEMTDINEGCNGLKTRKLPTGPHDYRKFVIHFFPEAKTWKPVAIEPRPWIRLKSKSPKETQAGLRILQEETQTWTKPGCLLFTAPKKDLQHIRESIKNIPFLEARIEEHCEDTQEKPDEETPNTTLSWTENKKDLEAIGANQLDSDALNLLHCILQADGATHNAKNDILSAWKTWFTNPYIKSTETQGNMPNENEKETKTKALLQTTS
jgi:DNA repair exonuclease SbcCD nuclease subunit